jgi:predicted DNA-binding transcriptional regulator YafY
VNLDVDDDRTGKRDRLARFYRVLRALQGRGEEGARIEDIARMVGMSKRTVYRDLKALEDELGVPVWSENGRWGVAGDAFLPPLKLTRAEAMAVFLSARLMVRYVDEYDADLAAAFQKLAEGLPQVLADHVGRTLEIMSRREPDVLFTRHVQLLTQAWAERRVVSILYDTSIHDPGREPRSARIHPWYIEPSLQTHALYLFGFDETRGAPRTFKIDRIRDVSLTAQTFEPPAQSVEDAFVNAWDIIADQPVVDIVLRFDPAIAARVAEAQWHPSQRVETEPDGSLLWRGRVAGTIEIRLWILSWGDEVEVVSPPELRDDVAATHARAAARYAGTSR